MVLVLMNYKNIMFHSNFKVHKLEFVCSSVDFETYNAIIVSFFQLDLHFDSLSDCFYIGIMNNMDKFRVCIFVIRKNEYFGWKKLCLIDTLTDWIKKKPKLNIYKCFNGAVCINIKDYGRIEYIKKHYIFYPNELDNRFDFISKCLRDKDLTIKLI